MTIADNFTEENTPEQNAQARLWAVMSLFSFNKNGVTEADVRARAAELGVEIDEQEFEIYRGQHVEYGGTGLMEGTEAEVA